MRGGWTGLDRVVTRTKKSNEYQNKRDQLVFFLFPSYFVKMVSVGIEL